MNQLTIIGNLTRDPESKTMPDGKTVCNFTVAVNRRKKIEGQPEADFFRIGAWGKLGENCQKYLAKSRKVCVVGQVSTRAYTNKEGNPASQLEVFAEEVEFLSGGNASSEQQSAPEEPATGGFTAVETDELPF